MFQKGQVKLKMDHSFGMEPKADDREYSCEIIRYDKAEECIYMILKKYALTDISRDAIYRCLVRDEDAACMVTGRIRDRYQSEAGNVLEFKIENGVYRVSGEQNLK